MAENTKDFPTFDEKQFTRLMDLISRELNLGAGIQITGDSGSGKSNLGEHLFVRNFELGVPSIYFDPHGDSVKKIHRMLLEKSRSRTREKLIFLRPSDLSTTFGFNPLQTTFDKSDGVPYEAEVQSRVEQTAKIIFSLFGEEKFEGRTRLRRYLTMWLVCLARAGLTLADAPMFANPDSPIYQQLIELAPDDSIRNRMAYLVDRKPVDLESEIGSTESRVVPVLSHPVSKMMFSRREDNLDFRWMIENDMSVLVDLSMSGESPDGVEYPDALTEEVQQLICNLMLTQYLNTVKATPVEKRKQRLLFIDELPVFESSAAMLMKACTEIRKFQTKFVFMHQGSTRFSDGHDNEFFQAICKMCSANVYFRHSGDDAKFFADPVARRIFDPMEVKYEHWGDQEFSADPEIVELISKATANNRGGSTSQTTTSNFQSTDSSGDAVRRQESMIDKPYATDSKTQSESRSDGSSSQTTTNESTTETVTKSQALKSNTEVRRVMQSKQFASYEEQSIRAINLIELQGIGECLVQVKGIGIAIAKAPEARLKLTNTSKTVDEYVQQFFEHQLNHPWFDDSNHQMRKRRDFEDSVSQHLAGLIEEQRVRVNPRLGESDKAIELHPAHGKEHAPATDAESDSHNAARQAQSFDPDWYDEENF